MTEKCALPAVASWAVYDDQYTDGHYSPKWVGVRYYCRRHQQPAQALAAELAAQTGPKARTYPADLRQQANGPVCDADRDPIQLGEVIDRERIDHAAEKARDALAELAHLTACGWGHSFPIGNEAAVLLEFLRLSDVVSEWVGVVARRTATRGDWTDVATTVNEAWQRHGVDGFPDTARAAWARWGGGPGDEEEPDA